MFVRVILMECSNYKRSLVLRMIFDAQALIAYKYTHLLTKTLVINISK